MSDETKLKRNIRGLHSMPRKEEYRVSCCVTILVRLYVTVFPGFMDVKHEI